MDNEKLKQLWITLSRLLGEVAENIIEIRDEGKSALEKVDAVSAQIDIELGLAKGKANG